VEGGVDVHDDHDASTIKLINRNEFIYLYSEIYKLTTVNTHLDDPENLLRRLARTWSLASAANS